MEIDRDWKIKHLETREHVLQVMWQQPQGGTRLDEVQVTKKAPFDGQLGESVARLAFDEAWSLAYAILAITGER